MTSRLAVRFMARHPLFGRKKKSGEDGKKAINNRNEVAAKMTPAQLEQAQEMARKCQASNYKNCE